MKLFICKNAFQGFNEHRNPVVFIVFGICGLILCPCNIYELIKCISNNGTDLARIICNLTIGICCVINAVTYYVKNYMNKEEEEE